MSELSPKTSEKAFKKRVIALAYDFDGTLCPDAMQNHGLLPFLNLDTRFWTEVKEFRNQYRSVEILTYMQLLMNYMNNYNIDWRSKLMELGESVPLFHGVQEWFDHINQRVFELSKGRIEVRHYIISSGLEEMITANLVGKKANRVFASSYTWKDNAPFGVARAITDASKPQYLFRINKGREDYLDDINDHMPEDDRPIPFSHIIFFGDGETDVPCMTVATKNGGHAIAVYDPGKPAAVEKCKLLYRDKRVNFYAPADYRKGSELWARTDIILQKMIADIRLEWANHLFDARVLDR